MTFMKLALFLKLHRFKRCFLLRIETLESTRTQYQKYAKSHPVLLRMCEPRMINQKITSGIVQS